MKSSSTKTIFSIALRLSLLYGSSLAFLSPSRTFSAHRYVQYDENGKSVNSVGTRSPVTALQALKKKQTAIYDGPEFISIASVLAAQAEENANKNNADDEDDDEEEEEDNNTFYKVPSKRAGYVTFVTGTIKGEEKGDRVLGIQVDPDSVTDEDFLIEIDVDIYVKKDSLAVIPKGISDEDAISTASAALSGVYCSLPVDDLIGSSSSSTSTSSSTSNEKKKAVVLGGGDYACFAAKALDALGIQVTMVTTRPMSLKGTPLNPLYQSNVDAMPPAVGDDDEGFSESLGTFDVVIDTLGDEANLERVNYFEDGIEKTFGTGEGGVASKLKRENNCQRYISTLTQSQKIVLKEGILFARDPVLKYQKELEKSDLTLQDEAASDSAKDSDDDEEEDPTPSYMELPPPSNYGPILQKLLESKIIFPMDRNENGSHKKKNAFVKGCSFPDYAEMEIWPSDSTDGAPVRFGFPAIKELAFEMKVEKMMGSATKPVKKTKAPSTKQVQENPFVYEIFSLNDITDEIVNAERDAVLFISAPYCKLCRAISPLYTRMARQSKEDNGSDVFFAKASSAGKEGKQLTFTLNVDSVPTFILFKKGQKYGEPFGVIKVPSKKLDKAIEYLTSGKEWDDSIVGMETNVRRTKLK